VHCDKNAVDCSFHDEVDVAGAVDVGSPNEEGVHQVNTCEIIVLWEVGEFPHCNAVDSKHVSESRTSWTVYLDYRVF
jgi:hypothetical protein